MAPLEVDSFLRVYYYYYYYYFRLSYMQTYDGQPLCSTDWLQILESWVGPITPDLLYDLFLIHYKVVLIIWATGNAWVLTAEEQRLACWCRKACILL